MPSDNKSLIVLNIRGTINIPKPIKDTLANFRLDRRYTATIVPDTPVVRGMLSKAKNYVAWCPAAPALVEKVVEKRGRSVGKKPLQTEDLSALGFKNMKVLAKAISDGKLVLGKTEGVKPVFRLSPPRGGFRRSTKRMRSEGGVLGENPDLPKLIEAMI
ncbi:MAG: 50S ribosomal protein L30 [Thaumarchaeota archaeon]|nr:50S ribosomal protein L30 [Nitrososphaerota archaeon]